MPQLLISYDLYDEDDSKPSDVVISELERLGAVRVHATAWLLKDGIGATALRDDLVRYFDYRDVVLVSEVGAVAGINWSDQD